MKEVYYYIGFIVMWGFAALGAVVVVYTLLKSPMRWLISRDFFQYHVAGTSMDTETIRLIYSMLNWKRSPNGGKYLFLYRLRNIKRVNKLKIR